MLSLEMVCTHSDIWVTEDGSALCYTHTHMIMIMMIRKHIDVTITITITTTASHHIIPVQCIARADGVCADSCFGQTNGHHDVFTGTLMTHPMMTMTMMKTHAHCSYSSARCTLRSRQSRGQYLVHTVSSVLSASSSSSSKCATNSNHLSLHLMSVCTSVWMINVQSICIQCVHIKHYDRNDCDDAEHITMSRR